MTATASEVPLGSHLSVKEDGSMLIVGSDEVELLCCSRGLV